MKISKYFVVVFVVVMLAGLSISAQTAGKSKKPKFDPKLAKKLGADERGMKMFVVMDPAVKAGVFVPELTLWYGSAAMMTVAETHKKLGK